VNIARVVDDFGNVTSQTDGEARRRVTPTTAEQAHIHHPPDRKSGDDHLGQTSTASCTTSDRRGFTSFDAYGRKQSLAAEEALGNRSCMQYASPGGLSPGDRHRISDRVGDDVSLFKPS